VGPYCLNHAPSVDTWVAPSFLLEHPSLMMHHSFPQVPHMLLLLLGWPDHVPLMCNTMWSPVNMPEWYPVPQTSRIRTSNPDGAPPCMESWQNDWSDNEHGDLDEVTGQTLSRVGQPRRAIAILGELGRSVASGRHKGPTHACWDRGHVMMIWA